MEQSQGDFGDVSCLRRGKACQVRPLAPGNGPAVCRVRPVGDPGPIQDSPVSAPIQSAFSIPRGWEYCRDPVATAGGAHVEERRLPFNLACASQEARGTLRTWNSTASGIIDKTVAPQDPAGSPVALALEEFRPKA